MTALGQIPSTDDAGSIWGKQVETARVTTGSVSGTGEADVTVTWATAFPDSNYTCDALVELDEDGEALRVRRMRSKTATQAVFNVVNNALGSRTGTLHATAIAD